MSDVTMLWRLWVFDFCHVMPSWHCRWAKVWQISARDKPKPRLFAAIRPSMAMLNHFISSTWVQWVMLQCWEGSVWLILDMPCLIGTAACQKFGRFVQAKPSQNQACLQPAHQAWHCWTIFSTLYMSIEWCFLVWPAWCLIVPHDHYLTYLVHKFHLISSIRV